MGTVPAIVDVRWAKSFLFDTHNKKDFCGFIGLHNHKRRAILTCFVNDDKLPQAILYIL